MRLRWELGQWVARQVGHRRAGLPRALRQRQVWDQAVVVRMPAGAAVGVAVAVRTAVDEAAPAEDSAVVAAISQGAVVAVGAAVLAEVDSEEAPVAEASEEAASEEAASAVVAAAAADVEEVPDAA